VNGQESSLDARVQEVRSALRARDPDARNAFLDGLKDRQGLAVAMASMLPSVAETQEETDLPILIARVAGSCGTDLLAAFVDAQNPNLRASVAEAFGIAADTSCQGALERLGEGLGQHEWLLESVGDARRTVEARLALSRGEWASLPRKDSLVLNHCSLRGASLEGEDLSLVRIEAADLRDANLKRARMRGTYLFKTDLCGASLTGADLTDADVENACFRGVDLRGVGGLNREQLSKAFTEGAIL
jgi:uncharacterized protein YjbI with pentapeptide repeats